MIKDPIPTSRALLAWQPPFRDAGPRERFAVAELIQHDIGLGFRYLDEDQLAEPRKLGFRGHTALPIGADHLNRIASDVLIRRLPPRNRPDFPDLLRRFGLPPDREYSNLSLLAYTGARMLSDTFSVCETFDGFQAPFTYMFDVVGYRHDEKFAPPLEVSEPLVFEREARYGWALSAIKIARLDGSPVGYVNPLQARTVGAWMDDGSITASVFRIFPLPRAPRLFVLAEVKSAVENQIVAEEPEVMDSLAA